MQIIQQFNKRSSIFAHSSDYSIILPSRRHMLGFSFKEFYCDYLQSIVGLTLISKESWYFLCVSTLKEFQRSNGDEPLNEAETSQEEEAAVREQQEKEEPTEEHRFYETEEVGLACSDSVEM